MTVSDMAKIAGIVGITQIGLDLLSRKYIFQSDSYIRSVSSFERAKLRRDKTAAAIATKQPKKPSKSADRDQKKLQRETEELSAIAAEVARRHSTSGFVSSIVFLFLYKVLSVAYSGNVVGVLPFVPFPWMQRVTFLSLGGASKLSVGEVQPLWEEHLPANDSDVTHVSQACAFSFIYMLCSLSVKMMANMVFGTKPPKGADQGIGTFMDSPQSQKMLQSFGLDANEVKEARSTLGL